MGLRRILLLLVPVQYIENNKYRCRWTLVYRNRLYVLMGVAPLLACDTFLPYFRSFRNIFSQLTFFSFPPFAFAVQMEYWREIGIMQV